MWEQSRREVEECYENVDKDTRGDDQHHLGSKTSDERELIIDDMKDEVSYLRRKLKESKYREEDLEDEIGDVTYKKEKLELEMDKVVQELTAVKKLLTEKKSIEKENNEVKETSDNFIDKLKRQNANFEVRIDEMKKLAKQQEDEILELKKDISENKAKEDISSRDEVESLEKEIQHLRVINDEKKNILLKVTEENETVTERLKQIEIENEKLKISQENDKVCSISLFEELEMCMISRNDLKCEFCNQTFTNENTLEEHVKSSHKKNFKEKQLNELKTRVLKQRNAVILRISKIKVEEIKEASSCKKTCTVGCKIWHTKHNWNKSMADDFLAQVEEIGTAYPDDCNRTSFTCDHCKDVFQSYCDLRDHAQKTHHLKKANVFEIEDNAVDTKNYSEIDLDQQVEIEPQLPQDIEHIPCEYCEKTFKSVTGLNEHVRIIHIESEERNIHVDEGSFIQDLSLENTSKEMSFPRNLCNICMLSFPCEEDLNRHIRIHPRNLSQSSILKKKKML